VKEGQLLGEGEGEGVLETRSLIHHEVWEFCGLSDRGSMSDAPPYYLFF